MKIASVNFNSDVGRGKNDLDVKKEKGKDSIFEILSIDKKDKTKSDASLISKVAPKKIYDKITDPKVKSKAKDSKTKYEKDGEVVLKDDPKINPINVNSMNMPVSANFSQTEDVVQNVKDEKKDEQGQVGKTLEITNVSESNKDDLDLKALASDDKVVRDKKVVTLGEKGSKDVVSVKSSKVYSSDNQEAESIQTDKYSDDKVSQADFGTNSKIDSNQSVLSRSTIKSVKDEKTNKTDTVNEKYEKNSEFKSALNIKVEGGNKVDQVKIEENSKFLSKDETVQNDLGTIQNSFSNNKKDGVKEKIIIWPKTIDISNQTDQDKTSNNLPNNFDDTNFNQGTLRDQEFFKDLSVKIQNVFKENFSDQSFKLQLGKETKYQSINNFNDYESLPQVSRDQIAGRQVSKESENTNFIPVSKISDLLIKSIKAQKLPVKIEVQLDPPTLGKVEITLTEDNDKTVLAVNSANEKTQELLRNNLPVIIDKLSNLNFNIVSVQINGQEWYQNASGDGQKRDERDRKQHQNDKERFKEFFKREV